MGNDVYSILELCGVGGLAFWIVGFCMLLVAVRKARREFRTKGYLRAPSGTRWFRFLLMKQYDAFDDPVTRFFFGSAHFCLMALIVILTAVIVLVGSETLLKTLSGMPDEGASADTRVIPS